MNEATQLPPKTEVREALNHRLLEISHTTYGVMQTRHFAESWCLCGRYLSGHGDSEVKCVSIIHREYRRHLRSLIR